MFPSNSSQSSLYAGLGFGDVSFGSQSFSSQSIPDLQGSDPNSPETFKQHVNLIQQQLARVQSFARSALTGIENAYQPTTNPAQTTADLVALRQSLQLLVDMLRQSGVGALPYLESVTLESMPSEEKLLADTSKSIEVQYAAQKRIQESAAVVFNLLGSAELSARR